MMISSDKSALGTDDSHRTGRYDDYFAIAHLETDLKGRSVRSGALIMGSQMALFGIRLVSTMVLARLLAPSDFGLVAMVTSISGFIEMFTDMGLSTATIQKANINHSQVSTLFWINVGVSVSLAAILGLVSPIISWFYGEPRLIWVTVGLAGALVLSGLAVQHMAVLSRQMRFKEAAIIRVGAMTISVAVGVLLACYGAGYWSLVWMSFALQLGYFLLSWFYCDWRPGPPVRGAGTISLVKFGGDITGFNIINYFARNLDHVLLGRFCGANVLGLYSKAYSLMMLPITQIRRPLEVVSAPALSSLQNDVARYGRYYSKLLAIMAFITMPLMVFLFIHSEEVIRILLGEKWLGAVDIFKILCVNALIQPVVSTWGLVLVSLGHSKRYLTWGIVNSMAIVVSFIIGLPWGAIGVASAYTVAGYLLVVPTFVYCFKGTPISIRDLMDSVSRPLFASIVMGLVIGGVRSHISWLGDASMIAVCLGVGSIAYIGILWILPGGRAVLREVYSYRSLLSTKGE